MARFGSLSGAGQLNRQSAWLAGKMLLKRRKKVKLEKANELILDELKRAEKLFPNWPLDVVHGAAILAEEAGEVIKASLDAYYGRNDFENLRKEVIQTAAMALRFLLNFEE
ncbi:MAG: hypothetical protein KAX11_07165 [Candidatus Aminicenantes bacterium]|nr:hypothetical protein [Candidatus Aminicenantes bacterium]